ncbi:MAG: radical SAM family heme chaperone HemW [Vampirovibrionia bacterium]
MSVRSFIYIHIPFCIRKCNYCNFCSFPHNSCSVDDYLSILKKEIDYKLKHNPVNEIQTVYLGGGTPSLLSLKQLEELLFFVDNYKLAADCEVTIEVNPKTVDKGYISQLKNLGINRISLGVQSFSDKLLQILGRPHNVTDVYNIVEYIKSSGINNLSIDLMYALPEQTITIWEDTLNKALDLEIQHISTYGLKIEPETPFAKLYYDGHESIPSDETAREMFLLTDEILTNSSFDHYEISNYAKKGMYSKHNLNYWHNNSYFGFGLSAHSFINGARCENSSVMSEYIANYKDHKNINILKSPEMIEDEIFLALRTTSGIDIDKLNLKYTIDFKYKYGYILKKYSEYFVIDGSNIRLNLEGMLLSNIILAEFLEV